LPPAIDGPLEAHLIDTERRELLEEQHMRRHRAARTSQLAAATSGAGAFLLRHLSSLL
jgi:hypothetical protein